MRLVFPVVVIGLLAVNVSAGPVHADTTTDALAAVKAANERHDYDAQLKLLQPLAEQGNVDAQEMLGDMYRFGLEGVPQDNAKAFHWYNQAISKYREAAERGSAKGQYKLGLMYGNGLGVPQDETEAEKWYRKAAEQGHTIAQSILAYAYSRDDAEMERWYRKAAEHGDSISQFQLGLMHRKGERVP